MKGKESPRKKGNKKKNEQRRIYANPDEQKIRKKESTKDMFSLLLIIPGLGKPSSSHVGSFFFPPQGLHICGRSGLFLCFKSCLLEAGSWNLNIETQKFLPIYL
jgi:hypothetical protein